MAKAADCKSAMSRFESGRRLSHGGTISDHARCSGVDVAFGIVGGRDVPALCIDFPSASVRTERWRGGFSFAHSGKGGML